MNIIDNIDRTLEEWGQNLRGGTTVPAHGLQPRDILRHILAALEENRVEGLDHKIYAPNLFVVALNLDEEERSRLMPFLSHEELEAAVQRHCQEHKYNFRGILEVRVVEGASLPAEPAPAATHAGEQSARNPKVLVQTRYNVTDNLEGADRDYGSAVRIYTPPDSASEHILEQTDGTAR